MGALFGSLFKSVLGGLSSMFGGGGAQAMTNGLATGATNSATSMAKGGRGLIDSLVGNKPANLPYSPAYNQPMMSPNGNGPTTSPVAMSNLQGLAQQQQQGNDPMSMKSILGAATAHSVGSKGGPGRQRADAAGQINQDVMMGGQPQNPMSMLAALQSSQPQQQGGPRQLQEVDPWTQYFMAMMNHRGGQ